MERIPNGTIVTGTRDDIIGHRHEITGYNPQTSLYMAKYLPPGGGLTDAGRRSPGLERELRATEFSTDPAAAVDYLARIPGWDDDALPPF